MGRDRGHPSGPEPLAHGLPILLVLTLLAAAVASWQLDLGGRYLGWHGDNATADPVAVAPPEGLEFPELPRPAPVARVAEGPSQVDAAKVEQALAAGVRNPKLGKHVVAAVGDLGGNGAAYTRGDSAFIPASTTKVLTATAALATMPGETRFATRVVHGGTRRDLVLVGGGDPYLASKPLSAAERATTYPERADVVTLARRTAQAWTGPRRVRVGYDDSLFTGPTNNPHWRADYVPDDIVTPITALWVDRGAEPDSYDKYDDPSLAAARVFRAALTKALRSRGVKVVGELTHVIAPAAATEVARVESAPLTQIVEHLLEVSDNETTEVVAHHVGLAVLGDGSFIGGAAAVMQTLTSLGVAVGSDEVYDGSGLSRKNRLSATTLMQVIQLAGRAEHPELRPVLTGLPVAGFTGSLDDRFASADPAGLGDVRAKTGTLTGVSSMAGMVTGLDGTRMAFVLAADKTRGQLEVEVEAALDAVAASLAACSCGSAG